MGVVVEPPSGHEGRQIRRDGVELEAGDEEREIVGVDADVGEAGGCAGARRIGAPLGLLLAVGVDRLGQPILDVARVNDPDVADLARGDHLARLADHRIAGVVERDREDETGRARERNQFLRLGDRGRERLVADDVDARFQEGLGDGIMEMVRGDDHHGFDAVRALRLPRGHLAKVRIDPVGREAKIGPGRAGVLGRRPTAPRP